MMFGQYICSYQSKNIQATSKDSGPSACMRRLFWAFAGRTYIVGISYRGSNVL